MVVLGYSTKHSDIKLTYNGMPGSYERKWISYAYLDWCNDQHLGDKCNDFNKTLDKYSTTWMYRSASLTELLHVSQGQPHAFPSLPN